LNQIIKVVTAIRSVHSNLHRIASLSVGCYYGYIRLPFFPLSLSPLHTHTNSLDTFSSCTYTNTHTHTQTHTQTHTRTNSHTHANLHAQTHTHAHLHTHTYTHTRTVVGSQQTITIIEPPHAPKKKTLSYTHCRGCQKRCTGNRSHSHAYTHEHTHTRTHQNTHTHLHAHTYSREKSKNDCPWKLHTTWTSLGFRPHPVKLCRI